MDDLDPQVELIVSRFASMLPGDGSSLAINSLDDGVLRLRYRAPGPEDDCEACVLTPDDLTELISEALAGRVDGIRDVAITTG